VSERETGAEKETARGGRGGREAMYECVCSFTWCTEHSNCNISHGHMHISLSVHWHLSFWRVYVRTCNHVRKKFYKPGGGRVVPR